MPFVRGKPENRSSGISAVANANAAIGEARHLDAVSVGETQRALNPVSTRLRIFGRTSECRPSHVITSLIVGMPPIVSNYGVQPLAATPRTPPSKRVADITCPRSHPYNKVRLRSSKCLMSADIHVSQTSGRALMTPVRRRDHGRRLAAAQCDCAVSSTSTLDAAGSSDASASA